MINQRPLQELFREIPPAELGKILQDIANQYAIYALRDRDGNHLIAADQLYYLNFIIGVIALSTTETGEVLKDSKVKTE